MFNDQIEDSTAGVNFTQLMVQSKGLHHPCPPEKENWGRIIKSIYNLLSHCLPCNSSHNVVNQAIGIMEAFSNVNIVAKLLANLQEVESSCRYTYNGVGGVIMEMKTRLESTNTISSTITSE